MIKLKRILISFIATLCVVMFVLPTFAIAMQNILEKQKTNTYPSQNEAAVTGFDLANAKYVKKAPYGSVYEIADKDYDNNTNFIINNLQGLLAFMGIVNSGNNGDWFRNSFSGKTIYLNADIDCKGEEIQIGYKNKIFKGNFDGQYHSITNFKYGDWWFDAAEQGIGKGFFVCLENGSYVKKLRLADAEFACVSRGESYDSGQGCVVGFAYGAFEISECVVENIKFTSGTGVEFREGVNGIIGMTCSVGFGQNDYINIHDNYISVEGLEYGIGPKYHQNKGTMSYVHKGAMNNVIKFKAEKGLVNQELPNVESYDLNTTAPGDSNNPISYIEGGLPDSSEDIRNSLWYYGGRDFNDDYLYPRFFIRWEKLRFIIGNSQIFKEIDIVRNVEKFIYVPKVFLDKAKSKEGKEITVCERIITAEPVNPDFSGNYTWVFQRVLYYENERSAVYRLTSFPSNEQRSFKFFINDNRIDAKCLYHQDGSCLSGPSDKTTKTYYGNLKTEVNTKIECFGKRSQIITIQTSVGIYKEYEVACFKSIEFSFTESDGTSHKIQFTLNDTSSVMHLGGMLDYPIQDQFLGANLEYSGIQVEGEWACINIASNYPYTICINSTEKNYNVSVSTAGNN